MVHDVVHTPGPWRVDETVALGAYGVWTDGECMRQVCRVYNGVDDSLPRQERDANARLIAAAPELLEALQVLWKEVAESGNGWANDFGWRNAREKTLDALDKAL